MSRKHYALSLLFAAFAVSPRSQAQVITTFAGNGTVGYNGDSGIAYHAELNGCTGLAVDGAGNVYIADKNNNVVRKVNTSGIITTFAGTGTAGYSGNGGAATAAKLNQPYSVSTDVNGNVYIADQGNNVIRIVGTSGIINTYAGNDTAGYNGDDIPANHASLYSPEGIAIDAAGNLYIADARNNIIREVSTSGIITTIAGNRTAGYTGDNDVATSAELHFPTGVAVDAAGNVFIADQLNNVIRRVDGTTGMITTYAGNHVPGYSGDGGSATSAQLQYPASVSLDQFRNLYIADQGNNTIRTVDSSGNISIFAGNRNYGYTGDYGLPQNAELNTPIGVTADGWGRIYIADYGNNVMRVVARFALGASSLTAAADGIKIYPNPSDGILTLEIAGINNSAEVTVTDVLGNVVGKYTTNAQKTALNLGDIAPGCYQVRIVNGSKVYTETIAVAR